MESQLRTLLPSAADLTQLWLANNLQHCRLFADSIPDLELRTGHDACVRLLLQGNLAAAAAAQAQRLSVAYNNLGGILKMQGRAAEAISCYEHVALLQPNSPEVRSSTKAACKPCCAHPRLRALASQQSG